MKKSGSPDGKSPSELIDARIEELGDWRGKMLGRLRTVVKRAELHQNATGAVGPSRFPVRHPAKSSYLSSAGRSVVADRAARGRKTLPTSPIFGPRGRISPDSH